MDANTRIDHMDEELKLIKNEIKQVLLEIQEHVLNVQNPFNAVVLGARAESAAEPAPPPPALPANGATTAQESAPQATPAPEQPTPRYDPPPQQSGPPPPPVYPGGAPPPNQGMPSYPVFPEQPARPQVSAAPPPRNDWPDRDVRPDAPRRASLDVGAGTLGDFDLGDMGDLDPNDETDWIDEGVDTIDFVDGDIDQAEGMEDEYDYEDEEDLTEPEEAVVSRSVNPAPAIVREIAPDVDEEAEEGDPTADLDLVTLASLVQWTDRVIRRAGPEYLELFFEISEMTGRLSTGLKDTLLALVKLLSIEVEGHSVGATETVRLLAQLDGLMGNTTEADARILPFVLDGKDLEVLSLIQR